METKRLRLQESILFLFDCYVVNIIAIIISELANQHTR